MLLILLTVEKVTHLWLDDKCSTSKEKTDKYQAIQDVFEECKKWKAKSQDKDAAKPNKSVTTKTPLREEEPVVQINVEERQTLSPTAIQFSQNQKDSLSKLMSG